jgi:hypothetical protein
MPNNSAPVVVIQWRYFPLTGSRPGMMFSGGTAATEPLFYYDNNQ